ncbi:MAG TPA: hypothetical protein VK507_14975 [Iamia sp.]|nr:hypothetical protein [Iamia sp.]
MRPEVVRLLGARQLIEAVKVVRVATGLDLQRAKDVIDVIAAQEGIDPRAGRHR